MMHPSQSRISFCFNSCADTSALYRYQKFDKLEDRSCKFLSAHKASPRTSDSGCLILCTRARDTAHKADLTEPQRSHVLGIRGISVWWSSAWEFSWEEGSVNIIHAGNPSWGVVCELHACLSDLGPRSSRMPFLLSWAVTLLPVSADTVSLYSLGLPTMYRLVQCDPEP